MNKGTEIKHIIEAEYAILETIGRERWLKGRSPRPEYQAKCFELDSVGNRKALKDYELRNEMYRTFLLFVFNPIAYVG